MGEVHISNKTTPPYTEWDLVELAEKSQLKLLECVQFNKNLYPGYSNKRGVGEFCDKSFFLGSYGTYI